MTYLFLAFSRLHLTVAGNEDNLQHNTSCVGPVAACLHGCLLHCPSVLQACNCHLLLHVILRLQFLQFRVKILFLSNVLRIIQHAIYPLLRTLLLNLSCFFAGQKLYSQIVFTLQIQRAVQVQTIKLFSCTIKQTNSLLHFNMLLRLRLLYFILQKIPTLLHVDQLYVCFQIA